MPRCPNCNRETLRTEDWACQWCGYPLLSGVYKKIPKTYKQLKGEGLHKPEEIQVRESEPELEKRAETIPEEIPILLPKLEPVPELEMETDSIQEHEPEPEPEEEIEPIQEPEPPAMELTVEELLSAYETDEAAANEKFLNKVLRVIGVVAMIDIKDRLETHYIRLTGAEGDLLQSIQCVFNKKHAPALEQLEKGQIVTVQGKYNGSIIAIRMVDCFLVL